MFDLDAIKRRRAAITPAPWEKAYGGTTDANPRSRTHGRFIVTEFFVRRPDDDTAIAADIIDPDTSEPHEGNAEFIAHAPTDIDALIAEVERLRLAVAYYTDATYVASWGMQEYGDNGAVARDALGLGHHHASCQWPESGESCTCGLQDDIAKKYHAT